MAKAHAETRKHYVVKSNRGFAPVSITRVASLKKAAAMFSIECAKGSMVEVLYGTQGNYQTVMTSC